MSRMNEVGVYSLVRYGERYVAPVLSYAHCAFKTMGKKNISCEIYIISKSRMEKLNIFYRNKKGATTILSFCHPKSFILPPQSKKFLGEIYLCPSVIRERKEDILFLVGHGILHLCGHTHDTSQKERAMEYAHGRILRRCA